MDKLKEIGIDFENESSSPRVDKSWEENFAELKKQIEQRIFKSTNEDGSTPLLYRWLTRQKVKYKEQKLEQEKIEKLKSLGLIE
ncbi:MAG: helicase associated domain-containing protein [Leptospiraceae bacterium]|nr:helicase associated domain-containing protein [Leptospiraceae bacterium]